MNTPAIGVFFNKFAHSNYLSLPTALRRWVKLGDSAKVKNSATRLFIPF
jgi:hypothetical protein